ncbi:MAG: hypothetical protein A2X28_02725 [Elusimicrobia bacterium GWA2_56_46]|nr:MAG: hypothetical protein A2X28_02725 [Elusimicrobia bacterium GWA2_56_46]OGR55326.1 MAG: hypothetical protein A2X39_00240 [Elusimicrobia bacterium GWC2_56_31]HBB67592.1 hypothetical protein [Elusimicrobiota bacterium]HBW23140.1 hypothetical protein [Elusimicrobiota bacterium]
MFKKLKAEDYPALRDFFDIYGWSLCEYSLSSIIAWNHCVYDVHYRIEGDLLFISEIEIEKPENRRLLLPLTRPFRRPLPAELAGWAAKLGYRQYYYAAEDYLSAAGTAEVEKFFTVREQPGYMDYIYSASDLAGLKGHKFSKKRNLIAQFNKQIIAAHEVKVEPLTPANCGRCAGLLDEWARDPEIGEHLDMLNCERKAILNALRDFELLQMRGVMVSIDGKTAGFAFGGWLSKDTFVLNFEKALSNVKGLYQFLDNEFAKCLPGQYVYINKESDLGKPGLAKTKESYYPCKKVKSYILTLR